MQFNLNRKTRQLQRLSADEKFFGRTAERALKKGNVFAKSAKTIVLRAKFLNRIRIIKVCKTQIEAMREFYAMRELRKIFRGALKREQIKPKKYALEFAKIPLVHDRVLVMKEEPGVLLHSVLFEKNEQAQEFLLQQKISFEETKSAFEEMKKDLEEVFSHYWPFLGIEHGNNVILKGKDNDGRIRLVLIDQPKPNS